MVANKTKSTEASPSAYLAAIKHEQRRNDCERLVKIMTKASKQNAKMWGTSIVGFGTHKYTLASGRNGEICAVGFSSRKGDISIYGVAGQNADVSLFAKLGKHKLGKGCLYIGRLSDVNSEVLEQLVANAVKARLT